MTPRKVTDVKKLINAADDVVKESLLGVAAAHPELRIDHENRLVIRGDSPRSGKVGLVSGGGSGHEPLHGGFVGLGMLDAAVCGEVFTSPTPEPILVATTAVDGGAGVLHIVKNYTGDVLNFEMAAELAADSGRHGRGRRHQRRRRRTGQPLHRRPSWSRRHRAGREDRRRRSRGGSRPRGGQGRGGEGQRERPDDGHGADLVHRAGCRQPDLRPARGPDGDRHRHPRRARPLPSRPRAGQGDRRAAARAGARRPAVRLGRLGHRVLQRHGRHTR